MRSLFVVAALMVSAPAAFAQTDADRAAVRAAVLDYVEGFYEGDSTKFVRSVAPSVYKYGYWRGREEKYEGGMMPFEDFLASARGVREEGEVAPPNAPKDVVVFDVMDQIANAKVRAIWGTDYLLLAKIDGRWMIKQVLWQSPPPSQ